MKRFPWFEVILIIVIATISFYGALADGQNFSRRWFMRDDAYYYFKVAQNISEGHGSTFDGINKTNGYHPLWMLICVPIFALARIDLVLPLRILFLVLNGLSLATSILLYRLIGRVFAPAIGAMAAVYWMFSTDIQNRFYQQGLETGVAAFFIVLLIFKLYEFERSWREKTDLKKDLIILGAIGILVILSRLDLVFFVTLAGLWVVFRKSPMSYLLPLDIALLAFSVLIAFVIKVPVPGYYKIADVAVKMLAVSLLLKIPLAYIFGLYQPGKNNNVIGLLSSLVLFTTTSSALLAVVMIVMARVLEFNNFPRMTLVYDAIATFTLLGLIRFMLLGLKTSVSESTDESPLVHLQRSWRVWVQDGLLYYGVAFGGLALYMLWNKLTFGTFSPVSGQIKRWWGSFDSRVYGGPARTAWSFFGVDYAGESNAWHPVSTVFGYWAENWRGIQLLDVWRYFILLSVFALVLYILLFINRKKAKSAILQLGVIPLLCGSWLQIFYYNMLGYSAYKEWYWISQTVLIVIVLSLIAGMLYQAVRSIKIASTIAWVAAVALGVYMGSMYWSLIRSTMTYNEWAANEPYMDMATFIEQHTEPGSIIGMTGGGNVGYFIHDRTIVNMDGLINSNEYFQLLKNEEAGKYLAEMGMNYIVANVDILDGLPYRGQYNSYMEWMDIRYGGKNLVRYHPVIQP